MCFIIVCCTLLTLELQWSAIKSGMRAHPILLTCNLHYKCTLSITSKVELGFSILFFLYYRYYTLYILLYSIEVMGLYKGNNPHHVTLFCFWKNKKNDFSTWKWKQVQLIKQRLDIAFRIKDNIKKIIIIK